MHAEEENLFIGVLILAGFFALILVAFAISMITQHGKRIALYKRMIAAEITTLERERKRMSADIHDALSPTLSGVKMYLNSAAEGGAENSMLIEKAMNHIDSVVEQMRAISYNLMPKALKRGQLNTAVREFIAGFTSGQLNITFQSGELQEMSDNVNVNVFRIIQEIIHNTLKHANAAQLKIKLVRTQKLLILETADDGKGFDLSTVGESPEGSGLGNIHNRTELLNGKMYLDTAKNAGTSYRIEIPI